MAREQHVVFFDIGNILIDDDPFLAEAFRLIHQALPSESPKARLERFWGDVERALRAHGHKAVDRMGRRCHGRQWPRLRKKIQREIDNRWWNIVRPVPGSLPVLRSLTESHRLGIIANQPPQVVDCLERWDLLPLFDVVVIDSYHHVSKPDLTLFRVALEEAKVDPENGIMVGDRLDNDVIPARRLGMRAVLMWLGADQKGWQPQDEWGEGFVPILERLPVPRWDGIPPKERPMAIVRRWDEVPQALERVLATAF